MASAPQWIWSSEYNDYYYYDGHGYLHRSKDSSKVGQDLFTSAEAEGSRGRTDSGHHEVAQAMVPSVPAQILPHTSDVLHETPQKGLYEPLDTSYRLRVNREAHQFFVRGRVFSILWAEPAGETSARRDRSTMSLYTTGRFGESVFQQIKRFVVVDARINSRFVYACPVVTYGHRGTLKPGCNPSEHTIIHYQDTEPVYLAGEYMLGMVKVPIAIQRSPENPRESMHPSSRIWFGKTYPIEMNLKVKDVGRVIERDMTKLLSYWEESAHRALEDGNSVLNYPAVTYPIPTYPTMSYSAANCSIAPCSVPYLLQQNYTVQLPQITPTDEGTDCQSGELVMMDALGEFENAAEDQRTMYDTANFSRYGRTTSGNIVNSRLVGELHSGYEVINKPKSFFKKGRVFMALWPEPGGEAVKNQSGPAVFMKVRRFVVIRPRATHCVCLPINTYQGKATSKPGVNAQDHAAVVMVGEEPKLHPDEKRLTKKPIFITVENTATGPIDPMSRINFAKVYTVEYNVKVRNIGRIRSDSVWLMDHYFEECLIPERKQVGEI